MPNIIEITDLNHPALAPYFRLTEAQLPIAPLTEIPAPPTAATTPKPSLFFR